ncbi:hypothetical protein PH210_27065 [Paenibacillus sp. BSR1-1]|nr:hypothetical protein [Paenibacillus sp. BSR1-1]
MIYKKCAAGHCERARVPAISKKGQGGHCERVRVPVTRLKKLQQSLWKVQSARDRIEKVTAVTVEGSECP